MCKACCSGIREGRCSGLVTVEAIEGSEACDVYWEVGIARAAESSEEVEDLEVEYVRDMESFLRELANCLKTAH
ncbi:uncharacterized protein LAJ45_09789 [Morchella importuna]|uniref:uncharacterized protein n=1 Tax=Morchella importuna TaxID=1174673 RepID=UPI001E8E89CF|nr:uncharacterized protein LAJ45_09789 [Morchella importuna]KAH8146099.1 hypothetical protein LAJ45_09789 [Morchella importuna]